MDEYSKKKLAEIKKKGISNEFNTMLNGVIELTKTGFLKDNIVVYENNIGAYFAIWVSNRYSELQSKLIQECNKKNLYLERFDNGDATEFTIFDVNLEKTFDVF